MDREQLRSRLLDGCDRALGVPRIFLRRDERDLIYGLQAFWRGADAATLDRLLALTPVSAPEEGEST